MEESSATRDSRPVFFFDIDNCNDLANGDTVDKFFVKHLSLDVEDAVMLHHRYYKEYGLAIEGLTRFHKIDPLVFNREVDDALPLDDILKPNMKLRTLLEDFDKTKVKLWLLTNAYVTHGKRVVKLLGVDDLFEGITYCDYSAEKLVCKPDREMYLKAEREAGAASPEECYFVDDSHLNCRHAQAHNWTTIHFVEPTLPAPETRASKYQIADLEEIRALFPQFFKAPN
ncbi:pyrimidine 5'-nucleotidase [Trichophyton rubrum]|uniref:Pyrimidine 5'-nucleotidase n=1 Tax=Trichophyton rubrum TaxID=5551 RepID=A0A178EX91_TRIRU|nr:pyrimidine 5'-nucleotidase [Trichophyton rubrum]